MSYKPVPTTVFKKYLKSKGLELIRTKGDHEIWDYPENSKLLRPITIIGCEKDIPPLHIKTSLETLGIKYSDFKKKIDK